MNAAGANRGRWAPHLARRPRGQAKEAILEAAVAAFASTGFAATTMGDISNAAQVGKGTVYQHWTTKEDLLLECCLLHLRRAQARVEAAAGGGAAESDPAAALRRVVTEALLAAADGDGAQQRLFNDLQQALAERPEQLADARSRLRELYAAWEGVVAYVHRAGVARGIFRTMPGDAQVPRLFTALVDGFAWQRAFRHDADPAVAADDLARLFVATLAA
jgi:TetR/AcrR family transcriptional regulator, transcriptional repressor for nem operon